MGDPVLAPLVLSQDERHTLENWAKRRSTAQDLALRARIVLASAQGQFRQHIVLDSAVL
jgi:hypothetical protein